MPTRWETYPVNFGGGLITNISPLTQGVTSPGSARSLINLEPSIEGGYKRVDGYSKFDSSALNAYGYPLVHGGSQTGTSLVVGNIHITPVEGDTLTIDGVTGTYTVVSVVFDSTNYRATITLGTALDSSPADKAEVTLSSTVDLVTGVVWFNEKAVACRGSEFWESSGSGWSRISSPSYGTCLVDGGAQSGTSLVVDGLTASPRAGDTFTITGVDLIYTVTSDASVTSGSATLAINPALNSSPADNASITFLSFGRSTANKMQWERYNFSGTDVTVGVDGVNLPIKYDGTTMSEISTVPAEVSAAQFISEFKRHIFFAQNNTIVFSAPYSDTDYTVASGGGSIVVPNTITGLILFREQLIVFCTSKIYRITGNTVSSFQLEPISDDIGCIEPNTIQEVGGDIMFLGPDGVRLLSATQRIGDFGLAVASKPIQENMQNFYETHGSFSSCVLRAKSQYRIFGYKSTVSSSSSVGYLSTQLVDQSSQLAWAELKGFKVYCIDSVYSNVSNVEVILFGNNTGYVYHMENSNSLDGEDIRANFSTPFFSINDPRLRKTMYKLNTYIDCDGSIDGKATLKFDFDDPGLIQPPSLTIQSSSSIASFYGSATYGTSLYGTRPVSLFVNQTVGSGYTVSVEYEFNNMLPSFSLDSLVLEFATEDRQ